MNMDGYMLRKLMEERGLGRSDFERFKEMMEEEDFHENRRRHHGGFENFPDEDFLRLRRRREGFGDMETYKLRRIFEGMDDSEKKEMWEAMMGFSEGGRGKHFTHSNAKYEVSEMRHTENGNKHIGEKYPIEKAEEVYKRYKSMLPEDVTVADVYVAINCHYHDFAQLYKAWFGDNIDTKIIESAIVFWFKDDEFPEGDKLWKYFKKMK